MLDMMGALHCARPAPLEGRRRAGVGLQAPGAGGGRVDGVADHGVPEDEAPGLGRGVDERELEQRVERRQRDVLAKVGDLGHEVGLERLAGDRRGLQHAPSLARQGVELTRQRGRDGVGHVGELGCDTPIRARSRELLEVERVATAERVELRGYVAAAQEGRLGPAQRRRRQPLRTTRQRRVAQRGDERVRRPAGPVGDREQHRALGWAPRQRRQQLERGGIGPVHVVEADDQRARRAEPLEQAPECAVDDVALGRRRRPAQRRGERGQRHGERVELAAVEPPQPRRIQAPQVRVEGIGPQAVGRVALELGRAAAEHEAAAPLGVRGQLTEQPRLADPRFARQLQERRLPAGHTLQRPRHGRELLHTSDQLRLVHGHRRAEHTPGRFRVLPDDRRAAFGDSRLA
jgi:hypothetical protein